MFKLSKNIADLAAAGAATMLLFIAAPAISLAAPPGQAGEHGACRSHDDWSETTKPRHIYGNTWYVGTCAISVVLITTPKGHILIDGAVDEAVPDIEANIRSLGFNLSDIKYILATHEHIDHVGGIAQLQRDTGAIVIARKRTAKALLSGTNYPEDPQAGTLKDFTPVGALRTIPDGGSVALGRQLITNIPMAGHAPGGQGWHWSECENGKCLRLVFSDSMTSISNDSYEFSAAGSLSSDLLAAAARLSATGCDILITGHVKHSNLLARLDGVEPLIDPNACVELARKGKQDLELRLKKERQKDRR